MESLAYIHLAEAYNEPLEIPSVGVNWPKKGWRNRIGALALGAVTSFLAMGSPAVALIRPGDTGSEIIQLQYRLQELGYFTPEKSGYYGDLTKHAVMEFQAKNGLTPDGIVGPETKAALEKDYPQTPEPTTQPTVRLGSSGGTVLRVQRQLSSLKYFDYQKMDGVFNEATEAAIKQFQQDYGLEADGVVGLKTHTALRNYTGL